MVKLARLSELNRRLGIVLAENPKLAADFGEALRKHDERALGRAFEQLHAGPETVRREVENAIIDWLFGVGGEVNLANVMPETSRDCLH